MGTTRMDAMWLLVCVNIHGKPETEFSTSPYRLLLSEKTICP